MTGEGGVLVIHTSQSFTNLAHKLSVSTEKGLTLNCLTFGPLVQLLKVPCRPSPTVWHSHSGVTPFLQV